MQFVGKCGRFGDPKTKETLTTMTAKTDLEFKTAKSNASTWRSQLHKGARCESQIFVQAIFFVAPP